MKHQQRFFPVLTSIVGRNEHLLPGILSVHSRTDDVIADVTYGVGNFWKQMDLSGVKFFPSDVAPRKPGVMAADMTCLPYPSEALDIIVIDPPYLHSAGTVKLSISRSYGLKELQARGIVRNRDILTLYYAGLQEAFRVLKWNGLAIVKCQDCIESGIQNWNHISIQQEAYNIGFYTKDLFVLQQISTPTIRWQHQLHGRKNHSYFWVFMKRRRRKKRSKND